MVLNIQMLRALAAVMVVFYHLGPHYQHAGGAFGSLIALAQWGFFGVDIFFVISGFVISYTVFPKDRDVATAGIYFRHRFSRIYLGYWPFALIALFILPLHAPENLWQVSALRTLTLSSADLSVLALPVAWSLAYELYFYAIFGALYLCSNVVIKRSLLVIFVLLLLRTLFIKLDADSNLYFWVSAYMLEFFYGVMLYLYRELLTQRRMLAPAVAMLIAGFVLAAGQTADHDARALYLGISAAAMVMLALQLEANRIFISPAWLVKLGDSSYALYLSHLFVITAFYQWGWRDDLAAQSPFMIEAGFLAVLLYIVFLAHFWYRRVERPLYLWAIGRKKGDKAATTPAAE
ncbi:MAG: acyltransferase [Xanthomonadales bacterium]|nr:acyltransferase [Xanthomonadales bacterium]